MFIVHWPSIMPSAAVPIGTNRKNGRTNNKNGSSNSSAASDDSGADHCAALQEPTSPVREPVFEMVVLGCGGGPLETDCSG